MASFKEHCAFNIWKGSLIVGGGELEIRKAVKTQPSRGAAYAN